MMESMSSNNHDEEVPQSLKLQLLIFVDTKIKVKLHSILSLWDQ